MSKLIVKNETFKKEFPITATEDIGLVKAALNGAKAGCVIGTVLYAKAGSAIIHSNMKKGWKILGALCAYGASLDCLQASVKAFTCKIEEVEDEDGEDESENSDDEADNVIDFESK